MGLFALVHSHACGEGGARETHPEQPYHIKTAKTVRILSATAWAGRALGMQAPGMPEGYGWSASRFSPLRPVPLRFVRLLGSREANM